MAFESLTDKLQNVFKNLRSKGRLTEADVKAALKEVKMALLEADVNFKVVKQFVKAVEERAIGADVMNGLNPGQMVIKIVNEEMVNLMGSETTELALQPGKATTVIMMCGLQGAGKTTAAAKIAGKLKLKGKKPLLVACDIYRPAAIEQLSVNAQKIEADFFSMGVNHKPVDIVKAALEHAAKNNNNVVIIDTAGRLHIDEDMMAELQEIKANVEVHQTLLVVDAMTGQDAVNVAKEFDEKIGVDGVILSKMDGDTRGGAALSVKAVTGKPILFVSTGEKLTDRLKKGKFDFEDYLDSMSQMKKLGGLSSILGMMPGMGIKASDLEGAVDEKQLARMEAIVLSMTPAERKDPKLLNPSRKHRIAKGAGVDIAVVNRFIKQFEQSQKMMKQLPGMMGGFGGRKGKFKFPF